jgi:hypothetical protein
MEGELAHYPRLVVTTATDVVDEMNGETSLREAIGFVQ